MRSLLVALGLVLIAGTASAGSLDQSSHWNDYQEEKRIQEMERRLDRLEDYEQDRQRERSSTFPTAREQMLNEGSGRTYEAKPSWLDE